MHVSLSISIFGSSCNLAAPGATVTATAERHFKTAGRWLAERDCYIYIYIYIYIERERETYIYIYREREI